MSDDAQQNSRIMLESVLRKGKRTASRAVDGEAVVFLPSEGKVRILNKVATAVWELVDGERTVGGIVEEICRKYEVEREEAERDALEFFNALKEKELVESL